MLKRIVAFSLDNSWLVVLVAGLIVVLTGLALPRMPVDVFPELTPPRVIILTEAGGYSADEVEQYITYPIELKVNGLPGVRRVLSTSSISLSIIWVEFDWGFDVYRARQLTAERLALARDELPPGVEPEIGPLTSVTGEIMLLALSSPDGGISQMELRSKAEFELRNLLLAVPGVSQVTAIGGLLPEYQIKVRQDRLQLYDLGLQDVARAAGQAHSTAGAGYLTDVAGRETPLRQDARVKTVDDIRNTVINYRNGAPLTVGDVASVRFAAALRRGSAADRGVPAVVVSIQKTPEVNTLELTARLDAALDQFEKSLPPGLVLNRQAFRQANFINLSIDNLTDVLRDAGIIVSLILILFLLNLRTAFITLTAIPVSLSLSLLILWAFGLTINVMTLGGLAVAIGELVDDAIVDVENILRRLRQNAALPPPRRRPVGPIFLEASNEVRGVVIFTTIILCVVFGPLLFMGGLEGRFFRPMAWSFISAVVASTLVALTLTPALAKLLIKGRMLESPKEGFVVRGLKAAYRPFLRTAVFLRWPVMLAALAAVAAAGWLASTFGTSFLPTFNEGVFTVFLMAPPGTSLVESDRAAGQVERKLTRIKGVRGVIRRTGRAERDEHAEPVSNSEIEVTMEPGADRAAIKRNIDHILAGIPGLTTMIGQPIEHRISHLLSGVTADVAVNIFGPDLAVLRVLAKGAEKKIKALPGARDVAANREMRIRTAAIRYRHEDLKQWGLTPAEAAEQVSIGFFGKTVGRVNQGVRSYDIVVRLMLASRRNLYDVRQFMLRGADGRLVRLADTADVHPEMAVNLISRENARRKALVTCNVAEGHNLGHLVREIEAAVGSVVAEQPGYYFTLTGQLDAQRSAARTLLVYGSAAAALILLLLNVVTHDIRASLLVLINLPLGLIGGVAAIYISQSPGLIANSLALAGLGGEYIAPVVSIAGLVGFITLFGVSARNGLVLVTVYAKLIREQDMKTREAIIEGSLTRLAPILMTALTGALGLVPLALAGSKPGGELLADLAVVGLGGLVSSTLLNLVVLPAGYYITFKRRKPRG